ncbi:MAG: hypothetical protein PUP93_33745 [Rhizonema sp. NSF051]|nr:hypothetical protein [Rhizonema sp. NSF051]
MTIQALPARPGIFLFEDTAGTTPPATALYTRTYFVGTSTSGAYLTPTPLGSLDDLTNLFGSTPAITRNTISAYLANTLQGLFFIRVPIASVSTVTVNTAVPGAIASIILAGVTINYTVATTDTIPTVIDALINAINNSPLLNTEFLAHHDIDGSGNNNYANKLFFVRAVNGVTFTISGSTSVTTAVGTANTTAARWDFIGAIQALQYSQKSADLGFIVCPEGFYNQAALYDRNAIANTMEQTARKLGWMALIDSANPSIVNHPRLVPAEFANCSAVNGHMAAYYPYSLDTNNNDISSAALTAAFGLQKYAALGVEEPPAGIKYPFEGIGGLEFTLSAPQKDLLASSQVNAIIFKRGVGYVPFDAQTLSLNTSYKMISTRVILNCIERTIFDTIDNSDYLFRSIGSRGLFYLTLRNTILGILHQFYVGGALYGNLPGDAYAVRCDASIQDPASLEKGIIVAQIFVVPAVTVRQISGIVYRVQIAGLATALGLVAA